MIYKMVSFCSTAVTIAGVFFIFFPSEVRQGRDPEGAKKCLAAIQECARTREGNLLALAVEAARARSKIIFVVDLSLAPSAAAS